MTPENAQQENRTEILLVEDTAQQRDVLAKQLEKLGYRCVSAETCAEARQKVAAHDFACALVDVGLPDGRGVELIPALLRDQPRLVPIMLTGDTASDTVIGAMRAGAFDYLLKPVDLTTLRACVSRAIMHHQVLREREELVELLRQERDQLKDRIAAATKDIRTYAASCETSNGRLNSLLRLARKCAQVQSEEQLLRSVLKEVKEHVPIVAVAMGDAAHGELYAVVDEDGSDTDVVAVRNNAAQTAAERRLAEKNPDGLALDWLDRHTSLDISADRLIVFPQSFWNRPVCLVMFVLERGMKPDKLQQDFLNTCAYFVAFEWQRARLMLHAAHHASLGNIAVELVQTFLQSLTAVRTACNFLEETVDSEETLEGLEIVERNVQSLTDQCRVFQQLSQNRKDSIETVQLHTYVDDTLRLLQSSINARNIRVDRKLREEVECVLLNGDALARTLLDLLSNVVRNVDTGGEISVALAPAKNERLALEIAYKPQAQTRERAEQEQVGLSELLRAEPAFLLSQRTIGSCGGRLTVGSQGEQIQYRIELPQNALETASA